MPVSKSELMIVVGEASGDELGADLVHGLKELAPEIHVFGSPGPKMRGEGVESLINSDSWSIVGIAAVAGAVPKFLRIKKELREAATDRKPAAIVLIDFPEFNLKLAKELKADGHRVIYYVSPQVWAWRQYRYKTIRDDVDLLLSILPFESSWYRERGVGHVQYVGNPVALRARELTCRDDFCSKYGLDEMAKIIALLPGSRQKEINRHLDTMLEAANSARHRYPKSQIVIATANEKNAQLCERIIEAFNSKRSLKLAPKIVSNNTLNVLNAADVAAISSGTATLEAGVIGTPMAVVYKIPKLDAAVFRPFVNVPHFALINLVANKRVVPELIQSDFTSKNLANELVRLLEPATNETIRKELVDATRQLRDGAANSAAKSIVDFIRRDLSDNSESGDRTLQ